MPQGVDFHKKSEDSKPRLRFSNFLYNTFCDKNLSVVSFVTRYTLLCIYKLLHCRFREWQQNIFIIYFIQ